jgi:glycosyltransferase involved in cell wall biosynthesis
LRICIDYTAAIRQGAGVGRFVHRLVAALLELDRENQYTLMYSRPDRKGPAPRLPIGPNVTARSLFLTERLSNILWYKLGLPVPIELLGPAADLYYFPDFALPPVRRGRTVITVHDLSFLLVPDCAEAGLRIHLEKVVPMSVRYADFVTVDSENTRNELTTLLDVEPNRVAVVYGGVDAHFHPIVDEAELQTVRMKYGLFSPFVLYVGTIEPRKNLGRLLRAHIRLRTKYGSRHRLVEIASEHEVIFLGRVPDEDLPALYSLADVFAFPSLYEGFGLPPLEAMACGVPVVCSNSSSLPEVVGDAGILVSPYDIDALSDALASLLDDPVRRRELAERGLKRARQFTWERSARQLLDIWRRVGA